MNPSYRVAVVGATGLVGRTMVKVLEERQLPVAELRLLASERSQGERMEFQGKPVTIEALDSAALNPIDFALFATEAPISRAFAPQAVAAGAFVIDNSSAFRLDPEISLVVPEVNRSRLPTTPAIVANPNCSTIQLVVALKPLHEWFGLEQVVVSTYQAVSGAGLEALNRFHAERHPQGHDDRERGRRFMDNCLPGIGEFEEDGHSSEETKIIRETRKILDLPDLPIAATAVRVPVANAHSEAVWLRLRETPDVEHLRRCLSEAAGVVVVDEAAAGRFPVPAEVSGRDEVFVGRIRRDPTTASAYWLWIVADNLRKGAATNAVQILEALATTSLHTA